MKLKKLPLSADSLRPHSSPALEAEWLKAKHTGNLGALLGESQKVLGLGPHGRPYRTESNGEAEDEFWAQVMPRGENDLEERVAKGGHGVPLSSKFLLYRLLNDG